MNSEITTVEGILDTSVAPGARGLDPRRLRRAIVTGGSTGIGRYTALALARDGCDVGITYAHHRDDAELTAKAIHEVGRRCHLVQMDLEDPEAAVAGVDTLVGLLGGLDIYVSNAGTMGADRMPHLTTERLRRLFDVNAFGAVLGCQHALRHLLDAEGGDPHSDAAAIATQAEKVLTGKIASPRKTPGRIIVVTSVHEHVASPLDTVYTMTKHALGGFIKCAAFTAAGTNVTVNGIRPGEIATPLNDMGPEDGLDADRPSLPAKRAGHPAEIADAIRFLASDASSFINGVSYDVDGGMSIGEPMAMEMYRDLV